MSAQSHPGMPTLPVELTVKILEFYIADLINDTAGLSWAEIADQFRTGELTTKAHISHFSNAVNMLLTAVPGFDAHVYTFLYRFHIAQSSEFIRYIGRRARRQYDPLEWTLQRRIYQETFYNTVEAVGEYIRCMDVTRTQQ